MSKGRSVDTSGTLDPSLKPLITGSSNSILAQQRANPVTDYNQPTLKNTAGLSDYQRFAGQQIGGLNQPNTGQMMALQSLVGAMHQAKQSPYGSPSDPKARTGGPSMSDYAKALAPYMGGKLPTTPTGSDYWQAPTPQGPMPRTPENDPVLRTNSNTTDTKTPMMEESESDSNDSKHSDRYTDPTGTSRIVAPNMANMKDVNEGHMRVDYDSTGRVTAVRQQPSASYANDSVQPDTTKPPSTTKPPADRTVAPR